MQVMHIISGLRNGGAEAILYRLVTSDTADEHCVISMIDDEYYGSRLRQRGIEVIELGMPAGSLTWTGLRTLFKQLRDRKPEIVQTWMYHADLAGGTLARLAGCRRVFWGLHHTTLDPAETTRTIRLLARLCAIASWVVPTRIISCSEKGVAVHVRLGYRRARFVAVPNGYDITEFAPSPDDRKQAREALGIGNDTTLFGMVGRWHEQKDHENLLRALDILQTRRPEGWCCLLVGPGVDEANTALRASCSRKGLTELVRLLGPTDDVPRLMNALDLHVLPSAFGEAFPNVVAEAMACGTPCVVTNVGDAALMVGDCGWVVPPRDPEALAAALEPALDARHTPAAWTARQERCVLRVREHFSLERMIESYRKVWGAPTGSRRVQRSPEDPGRADS